MRSDFSLNSGSGKQEAIRNRGGGIWTYIGSQLREPRGRIRRIPGVPPCDGWSRRWHKGSTVQRVLLRREKGPVRRTDVDIGSM